VFTYRTSVGLDVHARSVVAAGVDESTGEVFRHRMGYDPAGVVAWVQGLPGPVQVTYEAGPTGFGLARLFEQSGVSCLVAAPSKLQRPTGDRVKTDAKDALHLARLLRLGEIVAVRVPTASEEAARDLVRVREDCRGDLMSARHRLSKLLLRYGHVYQGRDAWTATHDAWLRGIRLPDTYAHDAFESAYEAVVQVKARRDRLDGQITAMARQSQFTPVVDRLKCLRGISDLTGLGLAVEIGDWDRFTGASIGAFLGLTPSEYSSGSSRTLGGITKTGNTHARRLLIEAAWHHRRVYDPAGSIALRARWERAGIAARLRGQAGNERLHRQWERFIARKKRSTVANTGIARELAGWCWSLAILDE
jgi:transposase